MDILTSQSVIEKVFQENPILSRIRLKADAVQAEYEKAKQDLICLKNMGMLYVNEGFRTALASQPFSKARNSEPFSLNDLVRASYALAEAFLLEGARQGDSWCYSTMGTVECRRGDIAANAELKCFHYAQAMAWYRWATALETPPIASGYPAIAPEAIDASGFYHLGHLYYMGLGEAVPADHGKAFEAFEYGSQFNVPSCLFESAVIHMDLGETAKTAEESTRHFDLAFQRLNALIQTKGGGEIADTVLVGCAYEQFSEAYKKGLGTQPDEEKSSLFRQLALAVFREASKTGHLLARYKQAFLTAEDALNRADPSLHQKAIQLLDQAIAGPNNDYAAEAVVAKQAEAHLWAGRILAKSKNGFKKACDRYYKAIKYGNDQAVIELTAIYYKGDGKKTYPKQGSSVLEGHLRKHPDDSLVKRFAEEIHFKAVAESTQGTPDDWLFYADFLHDRIENPDNGSRGAKATYLDAERWYSKASEAGHTDAMNGLAILLYTGSGKDDEGATAKALQLWLMAASQGNIMAVCNLTALFFAQAFELDELKKIIEPVRQTLITDPNAATVVVKLYAMGLLEVPKNAHLLQVDQKLKKQPLSLEAIQSLLQAGSEDHLEQMSYINDRILAHLAKARLLQDGLIPNFSTEQTPVEILRLLFQAAGPDLSLDAQLYLQGFDQSVLLFYAQDCVRIVVESLKNQFLYNTEAYTCLAEIVTMLTHHEIINECERLCVEQCFEQLPSTYRLPKLPAFNG